MGAVGVQGAQGYGCMPLAQRTFQDPSRWLLWPLPQHKPHRQPPSPRYHVLIFHST